LAGSRVAEARLLLALHDDAVGGATGRISAASHEEVNEQSKLPTTTVGDFLVSPKSHSHAKDFTAGRGTRSGAAFAISCKAPI
jgi:hypothetical protein